jgi:hypothetical protein
MPWLLFLTGLVVWIAVQGALTVVPIWSRALPPEVDDSLSYVLKSRLMEECYQRDCPALVDLREELHGRASDPKSYPHRRIARSRIFPTYHPLFSAVLLGLKKLGLDWMTAYKWLWTIGPIFFGLAFVCLLASLWGLPAAGIGLGLLAFKVFPDTGLHHVVPSNFAMGMAALIWARIISKKGKVLWTMIAGSILMIAMHPVGRLYAVMALLLMLSLSGIDRRPRTWISVLVVLLVVGFAFIISDVTQLPKFVNLHPIPKGEAPFLQMATGAVENLIEVFSNIVRMEAGLFGSIPLFFGAVVIGFLTAPVERRAAARKIVAIYAFFLFALLFYVSSHPGDVIFRIWIPFVVILFGAVGQAIWYALCESWRLLKERVKDTAGVAHFGLKEAWPVVLLAVLLGYSFHMTTRGVEQVYATVQHVKERQPLKFDASQPKLLLSRARPGDRVLYTSIIIMPYYFIHGAMRLGAVYYHPSMKGSKLEEKWLNRPDLRFAVTYNPTVYHPSFEGLSEEDWCVSAPSFHFSPLNDIRRYGPISREGMAPASRFRWIEVRVKEKDFPRHFRILIENPGKESRIDLAPVREGGELLSEFKVTATIPSKWSGWVALDLGKIPSLKNFRIILPKGKPRFLIGGMVFGNVPFHWPWAEKADLMFQPREAETGPITISFDPSKILPGPLSRRDVRVLDDRGSSVLFEIEQ